MADCPNNTSFILVICMSFHMPLEIRTIRNYSDGFHNEKRRCKVNFFLCRPGIKEGREGSTFT
jgi:hypothetical protein